MKCSNVRTVRLVASCLAWFGLGQLPTVLVAQETDADDPNSVVRPVTTSITLQVGESKVRDTYLTPLLYTGHSTTIQYERWRRMRHGKLSNQQIISGNFSKGRDKSDNGDTWAGRLRYRYALHFTVLNVGDWRLLVGPYANLEAGFNYNLKLQSSNNPATVRLVENQGLSAASFYHYHIRRQSCVVSLQMQAPLLGSSFGPEYGASYYETFYIEDASDDIHFTHPGNQQDLDLRLTTDLPAAIVPWFRHSETTFRLGCQYHIETARMNHITTRYSTFEFVFGWTYQYLPYHHTRRETLRSTPLEAY